MRQGFGEKFDHNRKTDFVGARDGVVFGEGNAGLDGWDAVRGENLLGLELSEDCATGFAGSLDDLLRFHATRRELVRLAQ